ncbi:hypothetical protein IJ843_04680 [bacterium]|nr:hypothetical protein [bacterium]
MKKCIIICLILILNIGSTAAKCALTGGACSIEDLKDTKQSSMQAENTSKKDIKTPQNDKTKNKNINKPKDKLKGGK